MVLAEADMTLAEAQDGVTRVNQTHGPEALDDPDALSPDAHGQLIRDDYVALSNAFALFDADGDEKLTEAEVVAVLTRKTGQGTELSEEAARATWRRWQAYFDLNDDGKISYLELIDAQFATFKAELSKLDDL